MGIHWNILGAPGKDNALHLTLDTGQAIDHFLFDCGEGCLDQLKPSQIQAIDHLAFSHFHMDHVSGFDTFFRHNYNRPDAPVRVWGPPGTIELMSHRFQGFSWNLHHDQAGEWIVHETDGQRLSQASFLTREAFHPAHPVPDQTQEGFVIHETTRYTLEARLLPHASISSMAYRLTEKPRLNISTERLQASGLSPGPWLKALSDDSISGDEMLAVGDTHRPLEEWRSELLQITPGTSIAYLTDFRLEAHSDLWSEACDWLDGTDTLISECQYLDRDRDLAARHGHMTSREVGLLAQACHAENLVLQHLSRRYSTDEWSQMASEAQAAFPAARFPESWKLIGGS